MNSSFVCYFFFALALFIACGTNVVSAKTIPQSSGEIDETGLEESSAVDSIVGNGLERAKIIDNINSMFNVDKSSTSKAVAKLKQYENFSNNLNFVQTFLKCVLVNYCQLRVEKKLCQNLAIQSVPHR